MSVCPLCSKEVEPWAQKLRDIYNVHNLDEICDSCGRKADSFLSYWGSKKQEDKDKLFMFINNGDEPQRIFSSMINGGYY